MTLIKGKEFAPEKPGRQFPGVGTGTVIIYDNHILLLKRAGAHGAGTWAIPGGWLDKGETPQEGASRECLEEIGCSVHIYEDLFWTNEIFEDDGIHSLTLLMSGYITGGSPTIMEPNKCTDLKWVPWTEVSNMRKRGELFKPLDDCWVLLNVELQLRFRERQARKNPIQILPEGVGVVNLDHILAGGKIRPMKELNV